MLVFTLLIRVSLKKLSLTPRMSFLLAMNLHPQASIHCFDIRFCIRFSRYFIPHKPYPTHQEESIIQPEHSKPSVSRSRIFCKYPSLVTCQNYRRGDGEIRTLDPLLARQVLSQLSYTPIGAYHLIGNFRSLSQNILL